MNHSNLLHSLEHRITPIQIYIKKIVCFSKLYNKIVVYLNITEIISSVMHYSSKVNMPKACELLLTKITTKVDPWHKTSPNHLLIFFLENKKLLFPMPVEDRKFVENKIFGGFANRSPSRDSVGLKRIFSSILDYLV